MALLPRYFRPAVVLKRHAVRRGILGPSLFWKVVAAWVFGKSTIKKFFGKQPEPLGTWKVGSNSFVNVINAKPPTKKQRKASNLTRADRKRAIVAAATDDARRKHPDAKIVVKTK